MKPLPKPVRLALRTLRTAMIENGLEPEQPLAEALWSLAHDKPGKAMDLAETITDAALDLGSDGPTEPAEKPIGFRLPADLELAIPPAREVPPVSED